MTNGNARPIIPTAKRVIRSERPGVSARIIRRPRAWSSEQRLIGPVPEEIEK